MHTSIIDFNLEGISEEAYRGQAEARSPRFREPAWPRLEDLAGKQADEHLRRCLRLARPRGDGGLQGKRHLQGTGGQSPYFGGVSIRNVAVLEGPTRVTRGLEEAVVWGAASYRSRTGPGLGSPPPAKKGSRR